MYCWIGIGILKSFIHASSVSTLSWLGLQIWSLSWEHWIHPFPHLFKPRGILVLSLHLPVCFCEVEVNGRARIKSTWTQVEHAQKLYIGSKNLTGYSSCAFFTMYMCDAEIMIPFVRLSTDSTYESVPLTYRQSFWTKSFLEFFIFLMC